MSALAELVLPPRVMLRCRKCRRWLDVLGGHPRATDRFVLTSATALAQVDDLEHWSSLTVHARLEDGPTALAARRDVRWHCPPPKCRADWRCKPDDLQAAYDAAVTDARDTLWAGTDIC